MEKISVNAKTLRTIQGDEFSVLDLVLFYCQGP